MDITLKDKNGVTLHTANKHCKEDISVRVDTQEITMTPSTTEQVEEGLFNKVTVQGDANLVPENIKIGTNIFGVEGGFDAVDTRDADAIASDITKGKTAYVNNQKVTGTMEATSKYNAMLSAEGLTSPTIITMLKEINFIDTSHCTIGSSLFSGCHKLEKIGPLDTSNMTSMYGMFNQCSKLISIPELNTSKVTNMQYMFQQCYLITSIPELDTSNVTTMESMFNNCSALKSIPYLNTSKVTAFSRMFFRCLEIESIPHLDTSQGTGGAYMFSGCEKITSIPELNTSNMVGFANMFDGCESLIHVPILDTSKATLSNMGNMFVNCPNLSNESLNNILQMCIKATLITNSTYKTLKRIGLTSAQATVCQGLSNYQAFLDAGWTTGY